jgi:hypothetical protein
VDKLVVKKAATEILNRILQKAAIYVETGS